MPLFLASRNTADKERMDEPNCDLAELENTYQQFGTINALISRWSTIYRKELRPRLQTRTRSHVLDIGFGGGDIPLKLAQWAREDHLDLHITAIDPDERAFHFARQLQHPRNIKFMNCSSSELLAAGHQFDFVLSNHLLHHLPENKLLSLLSEARQLSRRAVFFNDIRRSDIGYVLFNLLARPVFRNSFITQDGLTSIERSYTRTELRRVVPPDWRVRNLFPFRLLLTYSHE